MSCLRRLPTDGTFDQEKPIHRLASLKPVVIYSYDLKSATDRWPLSVIHDTLAVFFGSTMASCTVNGCLGLNSFELRPPLVRRRARVCFVCGQPLGYYSSWALFALSHHVVVWLAASLAYPRLQRPFLRYALLGDDIVIADKRVAMEYRSLLSRLGVSISDPKSIVSDNGTFEFAKKYWTCVPIFRDLSPVSMKNLLTVRSSVGLCALGQKYSLSINGVLRLAGAGYRVRGALGGQLSRKWQRLQVIFSKPNRKSSQSLAVWMCGGLPMSPYVKGIIVALLLWKLKPKNLVLPGDEVVESFTVGILEYTLYHNWMKMWLRSYSRYWQLHLIADPPLEAFLLCLDLVSFPVLSQIKPQAPLLVVPFRQFL